MTLLSLFNQIVLQYAYYVHVEPILRLVPDLMVKSRKSAELARRWWTESCRFQDNLKGNIKLVKQYLAEVRIVVMLLLLL